MPYHRNYTPNYNNKQPFRPDFKRSLEPPVTPPPFWLKVRKDYVLENFQELLEYMQKYPYREGSVNPDFDDTLECMSELSFDFATEFSSTPFQKNPSFSVPTDQVITLMAATVLARLKRGDSPTPVLLPLAALLINTYPDLPQGTQAALWKVIIACATNRIVSRIAYSWRLIQGDMNPRILAEKIAETTFQAPENNDDRFFLENNGLMIVTTSGNVILSALNLTDYSLKRPRSQFIGGAGLISGGMCELHVKQSEFERLSDFSLSFKVATGLMRSLSDFKPSAQRRLKEYVEGDVLPVRIINKVGIKVVVQSIDPDYNVVQGNVYMKFDPDHRPSIDLIRDYMQPGDIIEVTYHKNEKCLFDLSPNLERYYRELGCEMANQKLVVFYDRRYPAGTQWISADGLRIGIADDKIQTLSIDEHDLLDDATEKGFPINVRLYVMAPKKDGPNFYLYAEPIFEGQEITEKFGRQEADETFADYFLNYCNDTYGHLSNSKSPWKQLSPEAASLIARTMGVLADDVSRTSRERLDNLLCAAIACHITDRSSDYAFLHHEILYLSRLIDFAKGREIRPLAPGDDIEDIEAVDLRSRMLETLQNYSEPVLDEVSDREYASAYETVDSDLIERVSRLIEASNSLAGIIRSRELDNIKKTIATALGVDDEYKTILSDRKWYGDESEQLEFKLSVVFPPLNRRRNNLIADPEGQKWAIIKAVCAFLNSTDGGTLLIGVNDFGFAEGVTNDMQELCRLRYISSPDMDHYKQHIMRFLDTAFREQTGSKNNNEIVTGRVHYYPEQSPEGKELLRIVIDPYPYDVVEIQGEMPEGMAQSYVRGSGRSQPLTSALAVELRARKFPNRK